MTVAAITDVLLVLYLALNGWCINRMLSHVMRQRDLIGKLTRRVWILEGSPKCEHDQSELEA